MNKLYVPKIPYSGETVRIDMAQAIKAIKDDKHNLV